MAKYKVIGVKLEKEEGQDQKFGVVTDDKGFNWDPNSEVTDVQINDARAKELVDKGELEVIEAPESWSKKDGE
jgi:hypothetical protein